jgi:hypothetical protein
MKDSQIRQHVTNLVDAVKDLFLPWKPRGKRRK